MPPAYVDACKTKFHKQLMESWISIKNTAPSSCNEILNEYIFHSSLITSGNDALNVQKFGSFYKQNNFLKLIDIFDKTTCNIMAKQALETKFKCCLNYMQFFMLKSAIPALWIKKLKSSSIENIDRSPDSIFIKLGHKLVNIEHTKTKDIYAQLLSKKTILPSGINVWTNLFPFLENYSWKETFFLLFKISIEPFYQSFQYKILNRILNCRENLFKWKLTSDPNCSSCTAVDTIEHHLYYCNVSLKFWKQLSEWLKSILDIKFNFTVCEILFGFWPSDNVIFEAINYLMLIGKWFLNNKKSENKEVHFSEYLVFIKSKLEVVLEVNNNNNKSFFILLDIILNSLL